MDIINSNDAIAYTYGVLTMRRLVRLEAKAKQIAKIMQSEDFNSEGRVEINNMPDITIGENRRRKRA